MAYNALFLCRWSLWASVLLLLLGSDGFAVSTSGRVQTHYGESIVQGSSGFEDGSSLQGVPNSQKYASGLLEMKTLVGKSYFKSHVRYLYDAYGEVADGATLSPSSKIQAHHLAWHRPTGRYKYGAVIGRFPIKAMGVQGHDGFMTGMRWSKKIKIESFIGIVSDFTNSKSQLRRESRSDLQGGGYIEYEDKSPSGYYAYGTGGILITSHPDPIVESSQMLGVQTGIWVPWTGHRLTSHIKVELSPSARIRQGRFGYSRTLGKWSNFFLWSYSNTTSYQLVSDIEQSILERDEIYGANVKARSMAYFDTQYKYSKKLSVQLSLEQTTSSESVAGSQEITLGPWVRDLGVHGLSTRFAIGQKKDSEGSSLLYRSSIRYYSRYANLYADYRFYPGSSITTMPRRETRIGSEVTFYKEYLVRADHVRSQTPGRHRNGFLFTLSRVFGPARTAPIPRNPPLFEGGAS